MCDEDIYRRAVQEADASYQRGRKFFSLIMTTSNHRPFTYPGGKIDIPSGKGRAGAVKYADFAVLDESPLDVEPEAIKDIPVWGTVLAGRKYPSKGNS